ncbi:putative pyruvate dehydrogenase [Xylaria sp. FL0043]|nr:putative pyruvate dehydrogenase [Xylaria sp. FL0043]
MLPLRVIRTRPGRLSTGLWPTLQAQARGFSSAKGSSSASTFSKTTRYIAITSVAVGIPCIWWLLGSSTRDEVPRLESPPAERVVVETGPSKDDVTRIISQEAYSFQVRSVPGVSRYDGTQLASNCPCEDRFTHGQFPSPWNDGKQWMAWAIFDGHAGWQTADLLTKQLLPFVRHSLSQVISAASKDGTVPDETIQESIKKAFVNLDDSIIKAGADVSQSEEPLQDKLKKLAVSYAGSCALLSVYDPATCNLHVACTGDSRAVLGQKNNGKWEAIPLSVDQTGDNEEEVARLRKEHPGEDNIVKGGRVLGMMVSRAFGDARWKWPLELQQSFVKRFYGTAPLTPTEDFRTPPYLTAEPVVTTTKIDPSRPSFLILASDGLWWTLSDQQAVDLVGKWVDAPTAKERNNTLPEPTYEPFDFGQFWKGVSWKFTEGRTTIQDDNVAVHLVRNALGGNHHELIAGRLAFSPPSSRRVRDDITVQVVFFNS